MKRLLLVEDEEVILKALRRLLERNHYDVECATSVDEALAKRPHSFDLVLSDLRLPGDAGTALIPAADPVPVIIMTSHASVRSAVDAMRHGAIDYIAKPFDHDELLMIIERSLQQNLMQLQNRALKIDVQRLQPIEHHIHDSAIEPILDEIVSQGAQRFLHLHGECGTARESLARAIHASSAHSDGPFLILDVSADTADISTVLLGNNQADSEHSFQSSDAGPDLPIGGYLHAAQNGTLVIRYPELMQADVQQALCMAVSGSVLRRHEDGRRSINLNLISISEQTVDDLVELGHLIDDYAQLFNTHQVHVPALRSRPGDIARLANKQLRQLARRHGRKKLKLSDEAMAALLAYDWPGNVAELDNLLSRAVLVARTHTVTLTDLGFNSVNEQDDSCGSRRDFGLDEYFRYFVIRNQTNLSETELAARLGISRKALWERRQKMNLLRELNEDLSS